ncbi:hypothetical protein WA026_016920 [Henosepilachna vigintioctopunctata]|uniref:Beta-glucuronidase n=1 Tax=Henosepilachna vigintioctopunctata TaxID=420089 RepID=A0AAW1UA98_9CUCU
MFGIKFYMFVMGVATYFLFTYFLASSNCITCTEYGILYPQDSETRQRVSLDGIWNFVQANTTKPLDGYSEHWYTKSLKDLNVNVQLMPVPASYNDITTDWTLRDHVGIVWYERYFHVPKTWSDVGRIWLRFGSVSYAAQVWINGVEVVSHQIGHLPFLVEISNYIYFGKENRITVSCDNTLLEDTIPQGKVHVLNSGRLAQTYTFDFFNYAGIDRSVFIYTTPFVYIDDISVTVESVEDSKAVLGYDVVYFNDDLRNITCQVDLIDKQGIHVCSGDCGKGKAQLTIDNPNLWWPYLMDKNPGYLYTFEVKLLDQNEEVVDIYRLPVGIRILSWTDKSFMINGKQLYLHGFGRHEDSDIRGKGLDLPLIIRDHNLIRWVGANTYRTSHYPYAEEIMDLADSLGIMIIDECPGVNIEGYSDNLLINHKKSLTELIKRDKNRPSVIMWSAANEPRTQYPAAKSYFEEVIKHIKTLDTSRPTTIVEAQRYTATDASFFVDIVSFNRYNGWYSNAGNLDEIASSVIEEATNWHNRFQKLVIHQEYGGDTLEGLHFLPTFIWSEEYQVQLMSQHFKAYDQLRKEGFFIGEFIWNFADFKTAQDYTRVGGNKKGIFTRNRQPKASAHFLRKRYWALAERLYNATLPDDLYVYVASNEKSFKHSEL